MAYCYRQSRVLCLLVCHDREPCKSGWTDSDALWIVNLGGPKEPRRPIRLQPDLPCKWAILRGEGQPTAKCREYGDAAFYGITLTTCSHMKLLLLLLHLFNGLFSRTTWLGWHQKGKPFWILLEKEMMAGCPSCRPTNSVRALKAILT